jgi:hypothetical protein
MALKQKQLDLAFFFLIIKEERKKIQRKRFCKFEYKIREGTYNCQRKGDRQETCRKVKKERLVELLRPTSTLIKPTNNSRKKVRGYYQNWLILFGLSFLVLLSSIITFKKHWTS